VILDTRLGRCAFVFAMLAAGPALGVTQAAALPPAPPAQPTRVATSFFFNSIENVDSVNETFDADFYLRLEWTDPRLAALSSEKIDGGAIWQPQVEVVNSRDMQKPWDPYFQFPGAGRVCLLSRFHGTFAAPLDLHDFPFDRQVLPIAIESSTFTAPEMLFGDSGHRQRKERDWVAPVRPEEVLGDSARLPEWKLESIQVRELDKYYGFVDASFSRYRIEILVSRRSGFYVWKVIAIEVMIVMLSWAVFLLDSGELGNRLAVSVTLLLATVAFSYVISGITPRISYLTLLDWFLLGCFALIFLSAVESVVVYFLRRRGKGAATQVDRWSLAAFPVFFLLFNALIWAPAVS
jgi:glycine receptor alpha-3